MLLITVVVLAGPVWVSITREAACNPELCYVAKLPVRGESGITCDIRQETSKLLPALLCPLLVGEGCPSLWEGSPPTTIHHSQGIEPPRL